MACRYEQHVTSPSLVKNMSFSRDLNCPALFTFRTISIINNIDSGRMFQVSGPLIETARFPNFRQDRTHMIYYLEADRRLCICMDKQEEHGVATENIKCGEELKYANILYVRRQILKCIMSWIGSQCSCWSENWQRSFPVWFPAVSLCEIHRWKFIYKLLNLKFKKPFKCRKIRGKAKQFAYSEHLWITCPASNTLFVCLFVCLLLNGTSALFSH